MKHLLLFTFLVLSLPLIAQTNGEKSLNSPKLKEIPIAHVFIPAGFDSNDNVEVLVEGLLPDLCYKSPQVSIFRDGQNITVKAKAWYYGGEGVACPEIVVTTLERGVVGILETGDYQVAVSSLLENGFSGKLSVTKATKKTMDEHIYANVEYIRQIPDTRTILLVGTNPSDCFSLKEVQFVDNGLDSYSILPKLEQTSTDCPKSNAVFEYEVEVPKTLTRERVLLHSRSMNGHSVNTLFDRTN
jgi:hypothetical protein